MDTYVAGSDVIVSIFVTDVDGNAIVPTALAVSVKDEDDNILVPETSISSFNPSDSQYDYTVLATHNVITKADGGRVVTLKITTASGVFYSNVFYILRSVDKLLVPINSFASELKLRLVASKVPNLDEWNMATEDEKYLALVSAHRKLDNFRFKMGRYASDLSRIINWPGEKVSEIIISRGSLSRMTKESFMELPERFREALVYGQIVEANSILKGDQSDELGVSGLLSRTVGESSMMFRSIKPVNYGLSKDTLVYLAEFLDSSIGIGRA
jgi:hypothetical protein